MGGMSALLILMVAHEDDEVRQGCCRIFNNITANNPRTQDFATRLGAVNLMALLELETTPQMREAILGSMSAFVRGGNFAGKRKFLIEVDGFDQLARWLTLSG